MRAATLQHAWAETWLKQQKRYNEDNQVCASESEVITRMLARENSQNMLPVYGDIAKHLPDSQHRILALSAVLDGLVMASDSKIKEIADAKEEVHALNWEIYEHYEALEKLYRRQEHLAYEYGISAGDTGSIPDWVEAGLNRSDVVTELRGKERAMPALNAIDYKSWPEPAALFAGLCNWYFGYVLLRKPECISAPLEKATRGNRVPLRDALRVMLATIEGLPGNRGAGEDSFTDMPTFRLSVTSLTNLLVTIGFHPDVATENTVKQARRELIR